MNNQDLINQVVSIFSLINGTDIVMNIFINGVKFTDIATRVPYQTATTSLILGVGDKVTWTINKTYVATFYYFKKFITS
ncbi:MAG: hypothetical protein LBE20_03795 [Deltaproteobacteria bacterium]|jgi:hypothetical protein|nr:hypothetical protein [Deltaproteobacteria bacterium]